MARSSGRRLPRVSLYTDGAVSVQHGPGGWGFVLVMGKESKEFSGTLASTTNQRAELVACIKGLFRLKRKCEVTVYSDSAYLVNSMNNGWVDRWKDNGWKTKKGEEVKNRQEWETLQALSESHVVAFKHVKGHSGDHYNERADALAVKAKEQAKRGIVADERPADEREDGGNVLSVAEARKMMRLG